MGTLANQSFKPANQSAMTSTADKRMPTVSSNKVGSASKHHHENVGSRGAGAGQGNKMRVPTEGRTASTP